MTKTEKYNERMALRLNKVGASGKKSKVKSFIPQLRKSSTKVNKEEAFTKTFNKERKLTGKFISEYQNKVLKR